MAKRRFGRGGSSKSNPFRKNIGKGRKPLAQDNLKTTGGEYTLDGKNYVGDFHIMSDGRAMTGKKHKGSGLFGLRRKKKRSKYLEPVVKDTPSDTTTDVTPTPTPQPTQPPPPPARPKIPEPLPPVDLSGVINQPYKPLASYGNQYPATDSSVKAAADTNVTSYYSGGGVNGHLGNSERIMERGYTIVLAAAPHPQLSIDFVVKVDGRAYTSNQMREKLSQARAEGNWYFINSVPIIDVNTSEIRPYGNAGTIFKQEEDYAFNAPSNQIDSLDELMATIDWTCRKQASLEEARPYTDRYDSKDAVAGRLDIDEVIASANKPPKIRWRRS
tara:strand:- start:1140 stop:2126 length:987 start_codon:yes stop_codon:yes gene_type:complete